MKTLAIIILIGTACSTAAPAVRANVTIAQYDPGTGNYSYNIDFMPDLDQKRGALPNGGSMYCVPTAAMNLITYAANFGFPELFPGPGIWEGVPRHNEMTGYLIALGVFMETDADSGTGGTTAFKGLVDWVSGDSMSVIYFARDENSWPRLDTAAISAAAGAVVSFCYGRYDAVVPGAALPLITTRNKGHCVTLQRAVKDNGSIIGARELRFRNPGSPDDGDLGSNSNFSSQDTGTTADIDILYDGDGDGVFVPFVVTSLNNPPPSDGRYRILDSISLLLPPGGLTFSGVQVNAQFANGGLGFVQNQQPWTFHAESGESFVAVTPHPEMHSAIAIVSGPQDQKHLVQMPHFGERQLPLIDLPQTSRFLVPGFGHNVFVISDTELVRLNVQSETAARVAAVPLSALVGGQAIGAATYNHEAGELLLFSDTDALVHLIDPENLTRMAVLRAQGWPVRQRIRSVAAWGGLTRRLVASFQNGMVAETEYAHPGRGQSSVRPTLRFRRLNLRNVRDALSVDIGDDARLYVADSRAGLLEFIEEPRRGWQPAVRPLYAGFDLAGRKFAPFRSRTNARPELHDTPEWENIDPTELVPLGEDLDD